MKKSLLPLSLLVGILMLAALACSFSASTANIREAVLARDEEGTEPTTVFAPDDTFYLLVDLANAPEGTSVRASWTAVAVEGADPNTFLDENELTTESGMLTYTLSNDGLWPVGEYKVDLYLNGELERTLEFEVAE